jgi:hypothetical protein
VGEKLVADRSSSAPELIQAVKRADWLEIEEIEWVLLANVPFEVV